MTVELAIQYIPKRMEELGYGNDYTMRFRHFVLQPKERIKIHADNQLFVLIEPNDAVGVKSDFGLYDVAAINTNEMQYEHQGNIRIRNDASITQHVRFIQLIPKRQINASNNRKL